MNIKRIPFDAAIIDALSRSDDKTASLKLAAIIELEGRPIEWTYQSQSLGELPSWSVHGVVTIDGERMSVIADYLQDHDGSALVAGLTMQKAIANV